MALRALQRALTKLLTLIHLVSASGRPVPSLDLWEAPHLWIHKLSWINWQILPLEGIKAPFSQDDTIPRHKYFTSQDIFSTRPLN